MTPDDAWPKGDRTSWHDDSTRTFHDFFNETTRPYTAEENAEADARATEAARQATLHRLRNQLAAGVADITAARTAALEDQARAETLQARALDAKITTLTQRTAVASFAPAGTYSAAQLGQVRNAIADVLDRVAEIQQALADFYSYRAAVDRNAVTTDDALLWLARLAAGLLDD